MPKAERLEVRVDAELRAKLHELAKARGVAESVVVRRLVLDAHRLAFPDARAKAGVLPVVRETPEIIPAGATEFHTALWESAPSEMQQKLYAAYGRGYASVVTEEVVDAAITTALHIAPIRASAQVVILAYPDIHPRLFARVKAAMVAAADKPFESSVEQTVQRMAAGVPPVWPEKEPPVWVAVGITPDDTTPKWLRRRLVDGAPRAAA